MKQRPNLIKGLLPLGILFMLSGCDLLKDLPIGKGFSAKYICSYVFNSQLNEQHVINRFVKPKVQPLPLVWQVDVDYDNKMVTVSDRIFLNESLKAKAIYRDHVGCTLLVDKSLEEVASQQIQPLTPPHLDEHLPWPHGKASTSPTTIPGLNVELLEAAVNEAFTEPQEAPRNTTSLLVAYDGQLIAEKYAHGVTRNTPLLGWSMTKSITGSLIGILNDQGLLNLDDPASIPGWQGTEKSAITIRDILHMASGLDFNEDYGGFSDVSQLLYQYSDQVQYAASRPLRHEPGTVFNYTTGDANLLAKIVQDAAGGTMQDAYNFYQQALFFKTDITSAFIEFDATGQFVGGAYGFMTARDWLRLGQLYLQEGEWKGEQVLSKEFIDYVTQPSPATDAYGGQIWLNSRGIEWPDVPEDAYFFAGHQGQRVVIIPSKKLVVLRTGVTEDYNYIGLNSVIPKIIRALPNNQ